jgi:undecaprenyl-diphosphatase
MEHDMADEKSANHIRAILGRVFKPQEQGILIAVLVLAAGLWALVELTDEMAEGETEAFDTRILLALRNPADPADPVGPKWVEELGRDFTALGGVGVLSMLSIGVVCYLFLIRKNHLAAFVAATVGSGILTSSLLKFGFNRPRPELVPHDSYVYTSSFPSGHSMMSALTYFTLAALLVRAHAARRVRIFLMCAAVLLTLAVGVSRVYLGVHWPTDVLAGWTAGAVWAIACGLAATLLQRTGHIEPATEHDTDAEPESTASG